MRNASEYDLFLPLTYNDGTPIEADKVAYLKQRLHDRFGGVTYFPQRTEGSWRVGDVAFRDEIVILRVLSEEVRESRAFFILLKKELQKELQQEEVLIVERKVEML